MPRAHVRNPFISGPVFDGVINRAVNRVNNQQGGAAFSASSGAPAAVSTTFDEDGSGNVFTIHPALYDVDEYDNAGAVYYFE